MKKIWLFCLCLASLGLVGCFHVPDEDWLPSRNKVNTWDTQKYDEMEQALDSFVDWINMISSSWNELKDEKNNEIAAEEIENIEIKDEVINGEEIIDNEVENEEVENEVVEENISSEE